MRNRRLHFCAAIVEQLGIFATGLTKYTLCHVPQWKCQRRNSSLSEDENDEIQNNEDNLDLRPALVGICINFAFLFHLGTALS